MGTFLKDLTKSVGQTNANDIRPLRIPTNHNFKGNNTKKKSGQAWRRSASSIRCQYTANEKRLQRGLMYRRQLLLAATSLPLKPQQIIASTTSPPPSLSCYHKLANAVKEAEKLKKTSHGSPEINDVVSWLSSSETSKTPNAYRTSDELSTMIAVSPAQEFFHVINEKEVVTARVRRSATLKLMKNKEEQLVLEGIEVTNDKPMCFHVYIILGQEEAGDEEEELYAGTFSHMPPRSKQAGHHNSKRDFQQRKARRCCLRLGLNDMLSHRPENVIVKLVPTFKLADDPIKVSSIFIDYT